MPTQDAKPAVQMETIYLAMGRVALESEVRLILLNEARARVIEVEAAFNKLAKELESRPTHKIVVPVGSPSETENDAA